MVLLRHNQMLNVKLYLDCFTRLTLMLIFEKRNTSEHVDMIDSFDDRMRGHFQLTLVLVIQVSQSSAHSELNCYSLLCGFAIIECLMLNIELCLY